MQYKIAFLGSHGSGKTSTINFIKSRLEEQNKKVSVFTMGWKQFHNPMLNFFSKIYIKSDYKKNKNDDRLERFKERSWFFYIIYYIELLTRYFKITRSNADFILMDRYFYEELTFMNGLKYKLFKKITPVPDLVFVLEADANTIRSRGHFVSEKKLENFYNKLKILSRDFPMFFIDSSKKYDDIYKKFTNVLKNDN